MSEIKASVSFVIGSEPEKSDLVIAEIDTRPAAEGGLNASRLGKTSDFKPGEKIAVLVWMAPGVVYNKDSFPNECYEVSNWKSITSFTIVNTGTKGTYKITEQIKFAGESRSATLSKVADSGTFKVCRWIGDSLETYYGGKSKIESDNRTVTLPDIPTAWRPSYSAGESTSERDRKTNEYLKKIRHHGIAEVVYNTTPIIFEVNIPSEKELEKYGKAPYPLDITVYCKLDKPTGTTC
jgi:hypothetical protein